MEQQVVIQKTTEMKNFEVALKSWASYKIRNKQNVPNAKATNEGNLLIVKPTKELLLSFGMSENEISNKSNANTDKLVSNAMKEYSLKLQGLYNPKTK